MDQSLPILHDSDHAILMPTVDESIMKLSVKSSSTNTYPSTSSLQALAMEDLKLFHHRSSRFSTLGFLDILRESTTLLRSNASLLMSAMALLIAPVSALSLSRPFLHTRLAHLLSNRLLNIASAATGFPEPPFFTSISLSFLSFTSCSPAFFTLSLLAKAAVMFTVACTYAGKKPSFPMFSSVASKLWKRLFYTYFWICIVVVASASMGLFLLVLLVSFLDALQFSPDIIFLAELAMGLSYSVILSQMIVIGNLAHVVSILEEHYGLIALLRSLYLIKGRMLVALSLFLATTAGTAMVDSLYQYRVIGTPESTYPVNIASRLWEGPLLVFMYSFLFLFDAIMSCVFYFTCKSTTATVSDKQAVWEHISIGFDWADE